MIVWPYTDIIIKGRPPNIHEGGPDIWMSYISRLLIFIRDGFCKEDSEELGTYPIKVRRVLITEGLWHSKTSEQVADLLAKGKSVAEIAEELVISEKNVQSYMPYSRGAVWEGKTEVTKRFEVRNIEDRMQQAAKNQVTNTEARSKERKRMIFRSSVVFLKN